MKGQVLATARSFCNTPGRHQEMLREAGLELILAAEERPLGSGRLASLIAGKDAVILGLDECDSRVIEAADRLRVISRFGVGVDRVDLSAAAARNIPVTVTPGANTAAVAELTIGLLFSLARSIPQHAAAAARGEWSRQPGWELSGKTLGLVGCGAIGRAVAERARALGMEVIAYDPLTDSLPAGVTSVPFDRLLAEADAVTLHASLTDESKHLIGSSELQQMKQQAVLLNTSRGGLVDEDALYHALRTGVIAGAAADVFEREPPTASPLLDLANFVATPHIGAASRESIARMAMMASQNVLDILAGRPNDNLVVPPEPQLEEK